VPDVIVTSDAVRARTTAETVANTAGYPDEITVEPSLYQATTLDVLDVLRGVRSEARTVLVVGHNPVLEALVQQLTGEDLDLPTAAIVHMTVDIAAWSEIDASSTASIVETWRPRD